MARVIVLGAGSVGATIAAMLTESGDYEVTAADRNAEFLKAIADPRIAKRQIDVADPQAVANAVAGHDIIASALPYFLNPAVARAARAASAHYFDLTEDVATTAEVRTLAEGATTAFVPQCGLAPGFIGITAFAMIQRFERVRDARMRVGALPRYPDNRLKYNLTWSTDGLINEYCNPCEVLHEGKRTAVMALDGLEHFSFDGNDYEAFHTSGGLGTLCETLEGQMDTLSYKTVRYPGHREVMKLLLEDLRLIERRELLRDVMESAIPITTQDVVLIFVTVSGWRHGRLTQDTFAKKIYGSAEPGGRSAIQSTTAAGLCTMIDLVMTGQLPKRGFVRQEQAKLEDFLANRFGRVYAQG